MWPNALWFAVVCLPCLAKRQICFVFLRLMTGDFAYPNPSRGILVYFF
jgi:hypothetical protein